MPSIDHQVLSSAGSVLYLDIRDEEAARWPWECARWSRIGNPAQRAASSYEPGAARGCAAGEVPSPEAIIVDLDDRKSPVSRLLIDRYSRLSSGVVLGSPFDLMSGKQVTNPSRRIVHLMAQPMERRGPVLALGSDDYLTPERLASSIDAGLPTLLVIDLALSPSPSQAAEQLMLANAFSWHLVRNAPDVAVVTGDLSGSAHADDRSRSALDLLLEGLSVVRSLAEIVGDLQSLAVRGTEGDLRDCYSLSTATPHQRFRLGGF